MCIIFIQSVHALYSSEQCLCVSVLETVCACAVSVVHDMHVTCIVEESLTTHNDKARLLPLPTESSVYALCAATVHDFCHCCDSKFTL